MRTPQNNVIPIGEGLHTPTCQQSCTVSDAGQVPMKSPARLLTQAEPGIDLKPNSSINTTTPDDEQITYSVGADDRVYVTAGRSPAVADSAVLFSDVEKFRILTAEWPMLRLVRIWNALPRNPNLTRFESRSIAVARLWRAIGERRAALPS